MIVMDLKIDNLFAFTNFHMNMSYPKKIVDSYIENEFLSNRPNFRYKKVNILMGGNASGKTSIGKVLMMIFNFIDKKSFDRITQHICDPCQPASFSMDFIVRSDKLYRIETTILPKKTREYNSSDVITYTKFVDIHKNDNYETCAKRLDSSTSSKHNDFIKELEKIENLTWMFQYPSESGFIKDCDDNFDAILNYTLRALDPAIIKVEKLNEVENAYVIRTKYRNIIIQEGKVVNDELLSSGTKSGIDIAFMISAIKTGRFSFYYCDEKFSYIHSDVEKAFLNIMINSLKDRDQLFFTTHNMDILDLPLPKHAFSFLKKDIYSDNQNIKCVSASHYLKRNTDSLRNAIENDLFSIAPNVELIYEIEEL